MRRRWSFLLVGVLLAFALAPVGATALSIDPNPVTLDNGTLDGALLLTGTTTGLPAGATQLGGTTGGSDITLLFQVSVISDAVETAGITIVFLNPPPFGGLTETGYGTIAGTGDVAVSDSAGSASGAPEFDFGVPGVTSGETSDVFFVSYSSVPTDGSVGLRSTIDPGIGGDFDVTANIVPEPGALALLGLAGGAALLRRRTASR